MILNMTRPKNEKEDLLLSINKKCEALIDQTHRKAEETLEFKMNKPKKTFHFKPSIQIQGSWMIGLTSVEVYNSFFNITTCNNQFELYTDPLDSGFSFTEMKDKIAELLELSPITPEDLEHKTTGPHIIKAYIKLSMEVSQTDGN